MNALHFLHWTYRQIRLATAVVLIVIPVAIVIVAWVQYQIILPSLSHYYFSEKIPGILRTMFTGMLIFVGGVMFCYRGFDDRDNNVLNAAGVFAVLVAFFPKRCDKFDVECFEFKLFGIPLWILHLPSAVLLFLFAAYAVWYSGGSALSDRLNDHEKTLLRRWKVPALFGMFSGILVYVPSVFGIALLPLTGALIVEMTGFFGFSLFWIGMTHVIYRANQRALEFYPESPGRLTPESSAKRSEVAAPKASSLIP